MNCVTGAYYAETYLITVSACWLVPCCTEQCQCDTQLEVGHGILGDIVHSLVVVLHVFQLQLVIINKVPYISNSRSFLC